MQSIGSYWELGLNFIGVLTCWSMSVLHCRA